MTHRVDIESAETLSKRWAHLQLFRIRYRRNDGRTETLLREVHDHGHGACVLPYDAARGTLLLVRQFRLPVHLCGGDGDIVEACAGLLDGDDPVLCARREAEEELGYRIENLRLVASTFMSPGAVTERITLFLAEYCAAGKVSDGGGHPDEDEDIEVIEMPFTEAIAMLEAGRIVDAKTVMLLLFLERALRSGR